MGMYKEALEKRALEASDIAWRLGGAAGGGVLGWLIGRIFNRSRKRNWLPWLTALGGMTAGGLATDAAMRFWPKGEGDGKGAEKPAEGADGQIDLSARKAEDLEKVIAAYDKAKAWREHNHFKAKAGAGIGGLSGAIYGWFDKASPWAKALVTKNALMSRWNNASPFAQGRALTTTGTLARPGQQPALRLSAVVNMGRNNVINPDEARFITEAAKSNRAQFDPTTGKLLKLENTPLMRAGGRALTMAADAGIGTVVGGTLGAIGDWAGAKYLGNMPNTDISYAQAAKELARRMKQ